MRLAGFLVATLRLGAPLLWAATGEWVAEESGVLNLGVEGMMLAGALAGFLGTYYTGSVWLGWIAASATGALSAGFFAFFALTLRCQAVVVALGLNLLLAGATGLCYRAIFGFASAIPEIVPAGPVLLGQALPVWLAWILPLLAGIFLFRTPQGAALRAVGENPAAARNVGIPVTRTRYLATMVGGSMAGAAGAYYSTVDLNVFLEGMTGGAGWIAIALVIFGNWRGGGILMGALLFGGAEALQLRLQAAGVGLPREFIVMIPYVLVIAALCVRKRRSNAPRCLGG